MKKREWVGRVYGETVRIDVFEDGHIDVFQAVGAEWHSVEPGRLFACGAVSAALWELIGARGTEAVDSGLKAERTSSGWVKCADCRVAMSRSLISHQSTCPRRGNGGS